MRTLFVLCFKLIINKFKALQFKYLFERLTNSCYFCNMIAVFIEVITYSYTSQRHVHIYTQ